MSMDKTLPERDQSKLAEQQGMFRKFDVRRVDGSDQPGGKHHGCRYFVLDLDHDEHAAAAMRAYAAACAGTHPQLAADLQKAFPAAPAVAPTWQHAEQVSDLPDVHEALKNFTHDATGDNGVGVVLAVMKATA